MNDEHSPLPYGDLSARMHIAGRFAELSQLLEPRVRKADMINVIRFLLKNAGYLANLIDCNFKESEAQRKKNIYRQMVENSLLVIMMGARRHGKTATVFDTAERIREMDTGKDIYWFGFSNAVKKYYPWMKQTTNLIRLENAILLFDEASIFMGGRESMNKERIEYIKQLPTLGHRDVTTVFMTQIERIDTWLWGLCDWVWFKPYPGINFTESNLKGLDMHRFMIPTQKWQNYIYDRQDAKPYFFDNGLPSVWNDELSKPYSLIRDKNDAINYMADLLESGLDKRKIETMLKLRGWTLEELVAGPPPEQKKEPEVKKAVEDMKGEACPKCGGFDLQRWGKDPKRGQRWRCMNCGAVTYKK